MPIEMLRARLSTAIVAARAQLLNLPGRIAPQLEGEPRAVIKEKLRVEVYAALSALTVNGNGSAREPMGGNDRDLTAPCPPGAANGASIRA